MEGLSHGSKIYVCLECIMILLGPYLYHLELRIRLQRSHKVIGLLSS